MPFFQTFSIYLLLTTKQCRKKNVNYNADVQKYQSVSTTEHSLQATGAVFSGVYCIKPARQKSYREQQQHPQKINDKYIRYDLEF